MKPTNLKEHIWKPLKNQFYQKAYYFIKKGYLTIESKYLQASLIPWLIAQVKLLEADKQIPSCFIEINVNQNQLIGIRHVQKEEGEVKRVEFLNHKLTSVFKLCKLTSDENCFAYFYKQPGSTLYALHAFYSNKSNIVQCLSSFQMQAIGIHETLNGYEKIFDFELVDKVNELSKSKLDSPSFIESILGK